MTQRMSRTSEFPDLAAADVGGSNCWQLAHSIKMRPSARELAWKRLRQIEVIQKDERLRQVWVGHTGWTPPVHHQLADVGMGHK